MSNTFYADGVNEYGEDGTATELYVDMDGNYFFVEYYVDKKEKIRATSKEIAEAFIEKYGTDLHKDRKSNN